MFDDTIVKILGSSYTNTLIKSTLCDFQDHTSTINKEGYDYKCTKLLFVDYIEPLMYENFYLNIDNVIYKIIKVDTCSDHMEVYLYFMDLKDIKVNDIDKKALIQEDADKVIDYKTIISDFVINTGDLIQYQDDDWLIIGEVSKTDTIYKATMRKAQHTLKFYVKGERVFEAPTIVEISTQSINEGKIISTIDGKIELSIRDIAPHRKITYNNRLILMGIPWEIEGYTRETHGLIQLYCKKGQFITDDDKALEIAFNDTCNTDIPEDPESPPVVLIPYSITPLVDTITLEAKRTFKVIDNNTNLEPVKVFTFTLEKAIEKNNIDPNVLITLIDNITSTSCRLVTNTKVKGYFYFVATCGDIIIKKLLRIKGMMDK
ncbi:hypothetical protein KTC92_02545 [Clostridium sp. CM027]|uniref:hypothetical protein n=1 Tax=Clostridium sp. CM027 TaxID=2849865 RepID=UPI001C6F55BA|nr:hypothetical protein [Clostridium sp. CM027]MBW9145757.1 hypothetical protein [Clostridium sp. CM027]UVE41396.1 hypothetical protein KTC92_02545 [Clostridium sp. CM027]